jgi:hypothetical protein
LAHPDDPQRALNESPSAAPVEAPPPVTPPSLAPRAIALVFVTSLALCVLGYVAIAVPGKWFPSVTARASGVAQLSMPRGVATRSGDELIVTGAADDGNTVISLTTDFHALDYPVIQWIAAGLSGNARVALLWQTDVEPARVNKRALNVESGQVQAADMHGDPHWLGRIVGVALAVQGTIDAPIRVRGVIAKPAGAMDTLRDRAREWTTPEPWTGASINTVVGGSDAQRLPLPLLLAVVIALCALFAWLLLRTRGRNWRPGVASAVVVVALVAWFALDARWTVNLLQQARATALQFAGKDANEKLLAGQDRDLVAFIEKARAQLPQQPARVFVVADADFFRGRAAYHLYPHNVWYEPYRNALPPADRLHAGDWIVVYQRRGVAYDAAKRSLRWDGDVTVPAELKLLDHGGALFVVR